MKKKLAAGICALLLCFSLAGCGAKITGAALTGPETLAAGKSAALEIKLTFNKEVSAEDIAAQKEKLALAWASSDEGIATVDANGTVTGIAAGEAEISVSFESYKAACKVNVIVPCTGVAAPESLALAINGENTAKLNTKPMPENATVDGITYKSSDETVATVSADGTVTAVANGEATITTTMGNCSADTKVTVTTAPTGITLDKTEGVLYVGGSVTVKATVTPAEAKDTPLVWKSSDDGIATVKDGVITAKNVGTAKMTVSTTGGKIKAEYTLTVQNAPKPTTPNKPAGGNTGTAGGDSGGATGGGGTIGGSTGGNTGGNMGGGTTTPPPPQPPAEPQHYHGNGSDTGKCPVCGVEYSRFAGVGSGAGEDQGDLS